MKKTAFIMKKIALFELRPTILSFRRAIGATVHKGIYNQHQKGRPYDCFAYILTGSATYDFGNYSLNVKAGDLLFLAKGSSYTMTVHKLCSEYIRRFVHSMRGIPCSKRKENRGFIPQTYSHMAACNAYGKRGLPCATLYGLF